MNLPLYLKYADNYSVLPGSHSAILSSFKRLSHCLALLSVVDGRKDRPTILDKYYAGHISALDVSVGYYEFQILTFDSDRNLSKVSEVSRLDGLAISKGNRFV